MTLLQASGLKKSYKGRQVVQNVSLQVETGQVVGLLGPNGAGKTTSFYMIVGLVPQDGGAVTIDQRDITAMPMHQRARQGIGYLPQEASIFRRLTVEENLLGVLQLRSDLSRAEQKEKMEALLEEFHIGHIRKNTGMSLSGGERRRVEIARSLAAEPQFILLDEPFAGIDPIAVIEIQRIIGFLKARGIGVLITDHNVRETLGICDHACIISEGTVLTHGTPQAIVDNPEVRRVYLGDNFRM